GRQGSGPFRRVRTHAGRERAPDPPLPSPSVFRGWDRRDQRGGPLFVRLSAGGVGYVQGQHQSQHGPLGAGSAALAHVLLDGLRGHAGQAGTGPDPDEARQVRRAPAGRDGDRGGRQVGDLGHRRVGRLRLGRRRLLLGDRRGVRRQGARRL
ncbi:MAG: Cell division protein MraZ, partial [uncultured Rubrobacteraceae bacterium]